MVGPGEVDDDLQPETAEECSKYGPVAKVIIYEVRTASRRAMFLVSRANFTPWKGHTL